jgi:hypothetical protein
MNASVNEDSIISQKNLKSKKKVFFTKWSDRPLFGKSLLHASSSVAFDNSSNVGTSLSSSCV